MRVTHSHLPDSIRKLNSGQSKKKSEFCLSWMVPRIPPGSILLSVSQFICFCSVTSLWIIKEPQGRSLKITIWSYISLAWLMKLFSSLSRVLWYFEVHRHFSNYEHFYSRWTATSSEVIMNWSSQIIVPRFTAWARDTQYWEMILCRCTVVWQFALVFENV